MQRMSCYLPDAVNYNVFWLSEGYLPDDVMSCLRDAVISSLFCWLSGSMFMCSKYVNASSYLNMLLP
jgi:hypothetical protein